jgi:hypothetical protein
MSLFKQTRKCEYVTDGKQCRQPAPHRCDRCFLNLCNAHARPYQFHSRAQRAEHKYCKSCNDLMVERAITSGEITIIN